MCEGHQMKKFGRMDEVKAARELLHCCWLPETFDKKA